jgi:peptidoglycan-N-acetylglucosamine deacetylase
MIRDLVGAFVFCGMLPLFADTPPVVPANHIAKYQGDRAAALSYTFDDGTHSQLVYGVPMLDAHGFHGTILVIASRVPDTEAEVESKKLVGWGSISWEKLRELVGKGYEMSNHSWSHPNLRTLDDAGVRAEIEKADQLIAQKTGFTPQTFCYPYNSYDDRIKAIALEHHVTDRASCTGLAGPEFTHDFAIKWIDGLIHDHDWGITMIHDIGDKDPGWTNPKTLNEQMDYVKSHGDQVWVDTFLTVACYVKERDAAKLTVTSVSDHKINIVLECSLARPPYNVPLTVVVSILGAGKAGATRGPDTIPVTLFKNQIQIEAVPGPEPIALTWETAR